MGREGGSSWHMKRLQVVGCDRHSVCCSLLLSVEVQADGCQTCRLCYGRQTNAWCQPDVPNQHAERHRAYIGL